MNSGKKKPEKIGDVLDAFLKAKGYGNICKEHEVLVRWSSIVGERIAKETECTRAENGKLYVKVFSASWRQELVYLREQLLESIKRETGCTTITEINFY